MKRFLLSLPLIAAFLYSACSPTFPLVQDTRTPTPICLYVKGNINEKGEKIYFTKSSINYNNVKISLPGEKMFCSEQEAQAAGWRKALK